MEEEAAPKRTRGRPEVLIDLKKLEWLASIGATNREIAAQFGVCEKTIEVRRRKAEFREVMDRGEFLGNISLRRKQHAMALAGDRTMLIWLGKQRLGQKDKVDHSGKLDVAPPPNIHVNFLPPKKSSGGEEPEPES